MKVEVDVLGSPSLIILIVSADVLGSPSLIILMVSADVLGSPSLIILMVCGRPGIPVLNNPYGLCGRKARFEEKATKSERRSCVKVEVDVLCSPSVCPYGLCGSSATLNSRGIKLGPDSTNLLVLITIFSSPTLTCM